jgi:DNA mismatch repair protein MLH3
MGQVDAKFIACAFSTPKAFSMSLSSKIRTKLNTASENTSTVVLIDQHAADERIRVERFLEELCIGFLDGNLERRDISAHPTRVLLTMAEARSIVTSSDVQAAFDRWGLRFSKDSVQDVVRQLANNDETWYTQLEMETVPEVIADKVSEDFYLFSWLRVDSWFVSLSQKMSSRML